MQKYRVWFLAMLFCTAHAALFAQVSMLSHIHRMPVQKYYSISDDGKGKTKGAGKTMDERWVAFSDSDENATYSDPYGRQKRTNLRFLQPLFVLKSRNGYCKVIAYDPAIVAPEGGITALLGIQRKKYRLVDRKKVQYLGWIKEAHLLHSSKAIVGASNLQPDKYLASINHPKMITQRPLFLHQDSILMTHAPGFRKAVKAKALLGDWLYLYKKAGKPAQYLVGTEPSLDPDTAFGAYGWVSDSVLVPLAQNMLLLPQDAQRGASVQSQGRFPLRWMHDQQSDDDMDSNVIDLESLPFQEPGHWALPVQFPLAVRLDTVRKELPTYIPYELIDIQDSKVYNCIGQPFTFGEYQALQKQLKTVNIVVVFEDGKEGKEALRNMITSFQELSEQTQSSAFAQYVFNYAAVGYHDRWVSDTLNWTNSFSRWLNFIQDKAEDQSIELETYEHVMLRGLKEAANMLKGKAREHNIVVVIGSKINAETFPKLFDHVVPQLAAVTANLLFLQSNLGKAQNYSDYVMQAKRIMEEVGSESRKYRQQVIVDNNLVKFQNDLKVMDRCGNGYLYDFPNNSMQKGGLFFPIADRALCPDVFEWVMDTLLHQIRLDNAALLPAMKAKFAMLGHLQQNVNPQLKEALEEQGIIGLPDQYANTYDDKFFVEVVAEYHPSGNDYQPGFLIRDDAFAELAQNLRRVVIDPKIDRNGDSEIDFTDRRRWFRELQRTYRDRNRFFHDESSVSNVTLARVIFMETGYPVNNSYFQQLPLGSVKRKAEQEELLPAIQRFYRDIIRMEAYPSERADAVRNNGTHQYFIIPLKMLP